MSSRPSNVARSRWAAELLEVRPAERVIELGCGPGVALAALAARATHGLVVGVDHSEVMIRQARRRNSRAVKEKRLRLVRASVDGLDSNPAVAREGDFDAALAVNTIGMWPEPTARLREIGRLLRPGGRIALVAQPRRPHADAATTAEVAQDLATLLQQAGFDYVRTETLDLDPPAAWVLGQVPEPKTVPPAP